MIKINPSKAIDLTEIEKTRKWLDYRPDFYETSNQDIETELIDGLTLLNIDNLYKLIIEVTKKEPEIDNKYFNIGIMTYEQYSRYNHCINNISSIDIARLANQKLTDEEKEQCEDIMLSCNLENSMETMKFVSTMNNFYLRTYTEHLLLKDPRSNYKYSHNVISKSLKGTSDKIEKKMKKIRKQEQLAWFKSSLKNKGL